MVSSIRTTALIVTAIVPLILPWQAKAAPSDLPLPQPPAGNPTQATTQTQSYASRLIAADVLSLGAFLIGAAARNSWVASAGAAGFVLAAPTVHWTEGQGRRGAGSLALRTGLPLLGIAAALGYLEIRSRTEAPSSPCGSGPAPSTGNCVTGPLLPMATGAAIGLLGAMVLDYVFLGKKPVEHGAPGIALAPSFSVADVSASVSIVGQF
jgi:hypothetical protein